MRDDVRLILLPPRFSGESHLKRTPGIHLGALCCIRAELLQSIIRHSYSLKDAGKKNAYEIVPIRGPLNVTNHLLTAHFMRIKVDIFNEAHYN